MKSTATTTAVAAATAAAALVLTAQPAPAATVPRPAVDGIWRTDGYGTVLAVRDGRLREYQTTAVSCLPGDTARRTGPGTYTAPDGSVLTLRPGADRTRATLSEDGSAGHRDLRRLAALPAACTRPAGTDPRTAFDVFWRSFEENYPFFAAKGVDWRQVRDRHRPTVHADTTKGELFAVFRAMVAPLHDAHVAVQDGDRVFAQGRPGTVMPSAELDAKVKKFVVARDLAQARNRRDFGNGRITYADLPGRLGYLRISGFGGYAAEGAPYAVQQAVLEDALDAILTRERTPHLRGLIIDLRVNGGGSDALGLRIARRLTDARYLAYAKRARNDPADPARHTRPQPVYVTPADGPRYTGPVAVLTGGSTVSAGETFTQALMGRPGGTVRIGQPTQGVFSDVMRRRLPGGLAAWLPNEEFLTRAGRTFDGPGIAPHLAEPVFTAREFAGNRDSAFDRAVQVLSRPLLAERAPAA